MVATILRVKRSRSQEPLQNLRLESGSGSTKRRRSGDTDAEILALGNLMETNTCISLERVSNQKANFLPQSQITGNEAKKSVVFKRQFEDENFGLQELNGQNSLTKRLRDIVSSDTDIVRLIDCTSLNNISYENDQKPVKRARILFNGSQEVSLAAKAPSVKRKLKNSSNKKNLVMDPLSRKIDECLLHCHTECDVKPFIRFMTDGSVASRNGESYFQMLNKQCSNGCGTALHIAAMINDKESVKELLSMGADVNILDSDNYLPAQVGMMAGNEEIANLLCSEIGLKTDSSFVYDYYITHGIDSKYDIEDKGANETAETEEIPVIDFEGGIGYWENGILVFERENKNTFDLQGELDYDSNDEAFEGNDYPDEDDSDCCSFDIDQKRMNTISSNHNFDESDYEDNRNSIDYSGPFGVISPHNFKSTSAFNDYAYDSEFDESDSESFAKNCNDYY